MALLSAASALSACGIGTFAPSKFSLPGVTSGVLRQDTDALCQQRHLNVWPDDAMTAASGSHSLCLDMEAAITPPATGPAADAFFKLLYREYPGADFGAHAASQMTSLYLNNVSYHHGLTSFFSLIDAFVAKHTAAGEDPSKYTNPANLVFNVLAVHPELTAWPLIGFYTDLIAPCLPAYAADQRECDLEVLDYGFFMANLAANPSSDPLVSGFNQESLGERTLWFAIRKAQAFKGLASDLRLALAKAYWLTGNPGTNTGLANLWADVNTLFADVLSLANRSSLYTGCLAADGALIVEDCLALAAALPTAK